MFAHTVLPPGGRPLEKRDVGRRGCLEAATSFLSWLALAAPTWDSLLPSRTRLVLEAGFIRIPLSVGGNPAVGLGFLFGDLLFFYHSLMRHGPRVPPFRAAAPDAVYEHK
ncbi:hypothetical protein MRX96_039690 [Rhipicephalus microplus]